MGSVTIQTETTNINVKRYRARAGSRLAMGNTMGQALDALTEDWGDDIKDTAILIQRFQPDEFFTEAQMQRKQMLLSQRNNLNSIEYTELEALLDSELDATVTRTAKLISRQQP